MNESTNLGKYKMASLIGTIIMAVGSFLACLATARLWANIGSGLLIVSIAIMIYGFSHWQP